MDGRVGAKRRVVHALRHVGQLHVALADGRLAREQRTPEGVVGAHDACHARRVERAVRAARVDAVKGQAPLAARGVVEEVDERGNAQGVEKTRARLAMVHQHAHVAPTGIEHLFGELVRFDARDELIGADRRLPLALRVARQLLGLLGARHRLWLVKHHHDVPRRLDRGRDLRDDDLHVLAERRHGLWHGHHHDIAIEHGERLRTVHPHELAHVLEPRARQERCREPVLEHSLAPRIATFQTHRSRPRTRSIPSRRTSQKFEI